MDAVFDTAIENGLDFMALTDHHDSNPDDFDYLLGLLFERTDVLVIPSVELRHVNLVEYYGHKNLYVFLDGDLRGLDLAELAANRGVRLDHCWEDVWVNVARIDATFGPSLLWSHHVSASGVMTTNWSCHDERWEPVVEIYDGWGNALTYDAAYDPVDDSPTNGTPFDWESADATVEEALDMGYRVGFVGGTDEHDTRPGEVCDGGVEWGAHKYAGGLTMVVLDGDDAALTRSAIYDELVAKRTLVTSGPRIPVRVRWTAAGRSRTIGTVIDVGANGSTTVDVRIPNAYARMVRGVRAVGYGTISYPLVRSATAIGSWSVAIPNAAIPAWLYVEVKIDGAMYYPRGCNDGGIGEIYESDEYVWSSPTWFE
jgi:hypothetical protein